MKLFWFTCLWCVCVYSSAQPPSSKVLVTDVGYIQERINLSIQFGNRDSQAIYMGNLALAYQKKEDYVSALEIYGKAIQFGKEIGDTTIIAGNLLNTGIIYKNQGVYDKGLENLLLASLLFEKLYASYQDSLDEEDLASCYNSIGDMYRILKQNKLALEYYREGLMLRFKSQNMHGIAGSLNFIGEFYSDMGEYDSALLYLDSSLQVKNKLRDPSEPTFSNITLLNKGTVYLRMNNFTQAEPYFRHVINNSDIGGATKAYAYYKLAFLYVKQEKFQEANSYSDQSIQYAHNMHMKPVLLENYALKRNIYEKLKDLASVVHYDTLYIALKDEILNEQNNKHIVESRIQHETDKKEKELIILQQEQKVQQLKVIILYVFVSLLLIIIILVVKGLSKEKKSRKQVQTLMKELNHRVKNNFQLLKSLLIIQKNKTIDVRLKGEITSIENRLQAMINIHKRLYKKDTLDAITSINMKTYIEDLMKDIRYSNEHENKLTLNMNLDVIYLHIDRAIPLGLIINEIITNACKHAFTEVANPILNINMRSITNTLFSIMVQDNGNGELTTQQINQTESFGLKLIQLLSAQIKAEVQVKTEQGVCYELLVKK